MLGAYNHLKKPPDVIRSWPFNAAAELSDWSPMRGKWTLNSGTYAQTPIATGWVGTQVANCNSRLIVTARLRRVDPQADPAGQHYNSGIFIKTTANYTDETVSGYWLAYNKCPTNSAGMCTGAATDPPGQAVFWYVNALNLETGSAANSVLFCQAQAAVNVNGYNTIKVISSGASHAYFLNDVQLCTANDFSFFTGGVMLNGFMPTPATGHSLAFDSVTIQSIGSNDPIIAEVDTSMDPSSLAPVATPAHMSIMSSGSR